MQNEETLGGRMAKLPWGIMIMILLTGALSYYFEHKQTVQVDSAKAAEEVIQQTIVAHQSGKPLPVPVADSNGRLYFLSGAAVLVPGFAGLVTFTVIRRRKNFNRQRRA
jgi:hypothetical protein